MSRYVIMHLNGGEYNGIKIVSKESIEPMERPRISTSRKVFSGEFYSYGSAIYPDFLGRKLISHNGSVLVHIAYMGYLPNGGYDVAVLMNSSSYHHQTSISMP